MSELHQSKPERRSLGARLYWRRLSEDDKRYVGVCLGLAIILTVGGIIAQAARVWL